MTDVVRVRLGCSSAFLPRAHHVLEHAAATWGTRLAEVANDEDADLAYGADASPDRVPSIREESNDPLHVAFGCLALLDEPAAPTDAWGRPLPPDRDLLERPADDAIDRLRALVDDGRRARGSEPLTTREEFAVALTHDIDALRYLAPHQALRLTRELVRGRTSEPRAALRAVRRRQDPYDCLSAIRVLEHERGFRSSSYFLVRHSSPLDGRDARGYARRLPHAIGQTDEAGLHGSTAAAESAAELARQRAELDRIAGTEVHGHRFHNLRFDAAASPQALANAGFEYDTSVGYAAREGFRAGTARPFLLYDVGAERTLDVVEIPLAAMETTFLSPRYRGVSADEAYESCARVLCEVEAASGAAAVLWHNSAFDDQLAHGYGTTYRRLLDLLAERGGHGVTGHEIAAEHHRRIAVARAH